MCVHVFQFPVPSPPDPPLIQMKKVRAKTTSEFTRKLYRAGSNATRGTAVTLHPELLETKSHRHAAAMISQRHRSVWRDLHILRNTPPPTRLISEPLVQLRRRRRQLRRWRATTAVVVAVAEVKMLGIDRSRNRFNPRTNTCTCSVGRFQRTPREIDTLPLLAFEGFRCFLPT